MVLLMFLHNTKNNQSKFFLLTRFELVLPLCAISLASSSWVATTRLAGTCSDVGKVEYPPTVDGAKAIDAKTHNSVQQRMTSPNSKFMETDAADAYNAAVSLELPSFAGCPLRQLVGGNRLV